jgi:outer membrane protein OmpA-like peptidoglycan-associated protein
MPKIITFILTLYSSLLWGQTLKVDTAFTADYLVDKILVGNGIRVGNVKMTGLKHSICYFSMDTNVIGMKSGLLLSTGNVFSIAKENTSPGTSGISWDYLKNKKYRSDLDLNKLCKGKTYDQMILEFDFVPFNNNISFKFSFASEEYTEYVGSQFNDVFAFIVTGDGIKKKNIAVIPGTEIPITINNINQKSHKELFINNDYFFNYGALKSGSNAPKVSWFKHTWNNLFNRENQKNGYYILLEEKKKLNQAILSTFEFDGFTKVLKASCILEPWKLYHLKIAIGDVGDAVFDSGVFLEEGSFKSVKDTSVLNFKDYPNLYSKMNWDSIFRVKKTIVNTIPVIEQQIDEQFEVTNINFDLDKYAVPDTSKTNLDLLADYLNKHKNYKLSIIGYTDNKGSKKHNLQLSENRALAVMYYLTTKGVERTRLYYVGNSIDNPIANNSQEKGRALNRRVELTIVNEDNK